MNDERGMMNDEYKIISLIHRSSFRVHHFSNSPAPKFSQSGRDVLFRVRQLARAIRALKGRP